MLELARRVPAAAQETLEFIAFGLADKLNRMVGVSPCAKTFTPERAFTPKHYLAIATCTRACTGRPPVEADMQQFFRVDQTGVFQAASRFGGPIFSETWRVRSIRL